MGDRCMKGVKDASEQPHYSTKQPCRYIASAGLGPCFAVLNVYFLLSGERTVVKRRILWARLHWKGEFLDTDTPADIYAIELVCQTRPFKKQEWRLELSSQQVGLRDAEGDHVLLETPEDAVACFKVPGFNSDTSNLGVNIGEIKLAFKIAKQDLEVVRQYVDTVVSVSDLQDLGSLQKIARKQLVWGGLGMVVCLVILVLMLAAGAEEDAFKIFGMGAFWGLVFVGKGIAGIKRHRRLLAMRDEVAGD